MMSHLFFCLSFVSENVLKEPIERFRFVCIYKRRLKSEKKQQKKGKNDKNTQIIRMEWKQCP